MKDALPTELPRHGITFKIYLNFLFRPRRRVRRREDDVVEELRRRGRRRRPQKVDALRPRVGRQLPSVDDPFDESGTLQRKRWLLQCLEELIALI